MWRWYLLFLVKRGGLHVGQQLDREILSMQVKTVVIIVVVVGWSTGLLNFTYSKAHKQTLTHTHPHSHSLTHTRVPSHTDRCSLEGKKKKKHIAGQY